MTDLRPLVGRPLTLRPATADDEPFLRAGLRRARAAAELAAVSWTDEQKAAFLRMQFAAQAPALPRALSRRQLRRHRLDGAAGRAALCRPLDRRDPHRRHRPAARVLQPRHRDDAPARSSRPKRADAGKPLRIHVERFNPALRLYERLGFRQIEDKGVYLFLEWEGPYARSRSASADPSREGGPGLTELAARYGISRKTAYKWVGRYEAEGAVGLVERSRAPVHPGRAISAEARTAILALRGAHPHWGPRKLAAILREREPQRPWPAPSTMGALLRRAGLSHAAPSAAVHRAAHAAAGGGAARRMMFGPPTSKAGSAQEMGRGAIR